jgi:hypothetical protein
MGEEKTIVLNLTPDELDFLEKTVWQISASGNMARVMVSLQDKLQALKKPL